MKKKSKTKFQDMESKELASHIKTLRVALNLSQAEFAKALEVSQSYLSQLEKGRRALPSRKVLERIAVIASSSKEDIIKKLQAPASKKDKSEALHFHPYLEELINICHEITIDDVRVLEYIADSFREITDRKIKNEKRGKIRKGEARILRVKDIEVSKMSDRKFGLIRGLGLRMYEEDFEYDMYKKRATRSKERK